MKRNDAMCVSPEDSIVAQYIEGALEDLTDEELYTFRQLARSMLQAQRDHQTMLPAERFNKAVLFIGNIIEKERIIAESACSPCKH